VEFVYDLTFTRIADELLDDEVIQRVEAELSRDPRKGDVIANTGGFRKLRVPLAGRGKSGGARAVYLYIQVHSRIYFVALYAKNVQATLTENQKRQLRAVAERIKGER
jgi:hypothetical protein